MKRTSGILSAAIVVVLLAVTASTRAASTVTYTVTTTANSGAGSLRQAILDANANPGADTITFAIGAIGSQQTISADSGAARYHRSGDDRRLESGRRGLHRPAADRT